MPCDSRAVEFAKHTVICGQANPVMTDEIPHSHSSINKLRKARRGAGFPVVMSVDTLKNTLSIILTGNLLRRGFNSDARTGLEPASPSDSASELHRS